MSDRLPDVCSNCGTELQDEIAGESPHPCPKCGSTKRTHQLQIQPGHMQLTGSEVELKVIRAWDSNSLTLDGVIYGIVVTVIGVVIATFGTLPAFIYAVVVLVLLANSSPFWHRGTSYPHPEFADAPFFVHDAGVVVLDEALAKSTYGEIPALDYLDRYAGQPKHLFEVVGYGLTKSGPFTEEGGDVRLKGLVKLNTLNSSPKDTFILLSNNPGKPHQGGTCFGDSGGPTFDDTNSNLVVAVTSFGFSSTCSGVGGAYRLDQPDDLAFLASFGVTS